MDQKHYVLRKIAKKSGGFREIAEPKPELKEKQANIKRWLEDSRFNVSKYAHGCTKFKSIVTNAEPHLSKSIVVCLDLSDFYTSVKFNRIFSSLFKYYKIEREVAKDIAETCTISKGGDTGYLPQGSPTSPILSNLCVKQLDYSLATIARQYDGDYTRYVDDLTFSSDNMKLAKVVRKISYIIGEYGFKVNKKKTRFYHYGRQQKVTGVILNNAFPSIDRKVRRNLRALLHNETVSVINGGSLSINIKKVEGTIAHFLSINKEQGKVFVEKLDELKKICRLKK